MFVPRVHRKQGHRAAAAALGLAMALCAVPAAAQQQHRSWSNYGGGPDNSHFYSGTQITKANVGRLQVAWKYSTYDSGGYQFNPIVADGVMYVLARSNSLVALDAKTGKEIWIHEGLQGIAPRGINYWRSADGSERRLLFQLNHTLQSIDAKTGKSITSFGTNGYVDLREGLRREHADIYRIQSNNPGAVFKDLLILGSVTGESYLSPPGDLRAYNVRTGALVWQFHTIPHPGEFGYDTWPTETWKYAGGVNTWGEITVDEERGIAYFPLGSSTYDFYGADRLGSDLFANSLLALDARTGRRLWHQQLVHHDLWDYDLVSAPQLTTVRRNGRTIAAVAQATKNGFVFVFDRVTGEPVFPVEERPVPVSTVPGEKSWPTQPFSTLPPFVRQSFTAADINPYLPDTARARVAETLKNAANEGFFTPPALDRVTVQMPGNRGGSNWGTTTTNPGTGRLYVVGIDAPALLELGLSLPGVGGAGGSGGGGAAGGAGAAGRTTYLQNCQACHGPTAAGSGAIPSLVGVVSKLGPEGVMDVIHSGRGQMPAFALPDAETSALVQYLATLGGGRGAATRAAPRTPPPPGPVVASGGAPAARAFAATMPQGIPPEYGAHGGPAYPQGLPVPSSRYYTNWNVTREVVRPPWSTLTAYDLNSGRIEWQIPLGEDSAMVAQGVRNSGLRQDQKAAVLTATGVLFTTTTDGYLRAFDAETGKELWSQKLPGSARVFPALYELDGRAYLAVNAAGSNADPSYVVYALAR